MEKKNVNFKHKKYNLVRIILTFLILIFLLCYIGVVLFNLIKKPTDTFMIENGKLYLEEITDGYILREEQIVQGENYKNGIVQIKAEGEKVAKNDAIFRYKTDGEDNLIEEIEKLNVKIQEALKNETSILPSSDITLLENQIQEKINEMYGINNYDKIKMLKKEINELILKKAKIVGDLSPARLIYKRTN